MFSNRFFSFLPFCSSLKDDDSGDHDQNEENSTQKDGEKEKNDREKSQSSTKRKVHSRLSTVYQTRVSVENSDEELLTVTN